MTLLFASILFLGASATMPTVQETPASSPSIAPAEQTTAAKPKKERKICRSEDKASSRIPLQVCKTAAQWSEAETSGGGPAIIKGNVAH